jgi:acetyl esterase/lipase
MTRVCAAVVLLAGLAPVAVAAEPEIVRERDVIYGRKFGVCLTMDVFTPKGKQNGAAVVVAVSGGWFSSHGSINPSTAAPFLKRGYTVFQVVHGSQPKFTIPEAIEDMQRSVRFIRTNAIRFGIDGDRIGVTGGSAGGHLSLMLGTLDSKGNPKANDAVEQASGKVQAVACFFPPTDFHNYGETGKDAMEILKTVKLTAPFDFRDFSGDERAFIPVTDGEKRREKMKQIAPINHVTPDDAPTLIVHGDADKLVPIQQAEIMIEKLKAAKVPAELIVKKGAAHGWAGMDKDLEKFADWFDKFLPAK